MRLLKLATLRAGPARFVATAAWSPLAACGLALLIFALAVTGAQVLLALGARFYADAAPSLSLSSPAISVLFLLTLQVIIVALTLLVAGRTGLGRGTALLLEPPAGGWPVYVEGIAGGLVLAAVFNALAYGLGFTDFVTDLRPFIALLSSPWWAPAVLAVAVGAPVAEELLFRGFLLPALSRSRLGFAGATALATTAWTAMHIGYSAAGLAEVFLMGLYFSWLLWRTGSLWVPLVCHAAFNATVVTGLLAWMRWTGA